MNIFPTLTRASLPKKKAKTTGFSGSNTSLFLTSDYSIQKDYLFQANTLTTRDRNAIRATWLLSRLQIFPSKTCFILFKTPLSVPGETGNTLFLGAAGKLAHIRRSLDDAELGTERSIWERKKKKVLCNQDKAKPPFSPLVQIYASLPLASVGVLRTSYGFL